MTLSKKIVKENTKIELNAVTDVKLEELLKENTHSQAESHDRNTEIPAL